MRKLTMSMCANRDYLEGYNRAVDDAAKDMDDRTALARLVTETDLTPAQTAIIREAGLH